MSLKESIINFSDDYPIFSGVIILFIAVLFLLYKLLKNEPIGFNTRNIASWQAYVSSWAIIVMLFMFAMYFLTK